MRHPIAPGDSTSSLDPLFSTKLPRVFGHSLKWSIGPNLPVVVLSRIQLPEFRPAEQDCIELGVSQPRERFAALIPPRWWHRHHGALTPKAPLQGVVNV